MSQSSGIDTLSSSGIDIIKIHSMVCDYYTDLQNGVGPLYDELHMLETIPRDFFDIDQQQCISSHISKLQKHCFNIANNCYKHFFEMETASLLHAYKNMMIRPMTQSFMTDDMDYSNAIEVQYKKAIVVKFLVICDETINKSGPSLNPPESLLNIVKPPQQIHQLVSFKINNNNNNKPYDPSRSDNNNNSVTSRYNVPVTTQKYNSLQTPINSSGLINNMSVESNKQQYCQQRPVNTEQQNNNKTYSPSLRDDNNDNDKSRLLIIHDNILTERSLEYNEYNNNVYKNLPIPSTSTSLTSSTSTSSSPLNTFTSSNTTPHHFNSHYNNNNNGTANNLYDDHHNEEEESLNKLCHDDHKSGNTNSLLSSSSAASASISSAASSKFYKYDRVTHFRNSINKYQGKYRSVPVDLFAAIDVLIKKHNIVHVTKSHIRLFLKDLQMSKHYDNINYIFCYYNNCFEQYNLEHIENNLMDDFVKVLQVYDDLEWASTRKNFISTHFVLYHLLLKNNVPCNITDFNILKTVDRLRVHDVIMKTIFDKLGWSFQCSF